MGNQHYARRTTILNSKNAQSFDSWDVEKVRKGSQFTHRDNAQNAVIVAIIEEEERKSIGSDKTKLNNKKMKIDISPDQTSVD